MRISDWSSDVCSSDLFASWSDPLEDVGWLCARCWRFGADDREVGGFGDRADFQRGYEAETGRAVAWRAVPYWEVLATVRWAIIALHPGERPHDRKSLVAGNGGAVRSDTVVRLIFKKKNKNN